MDHDAIIFDLDGTLLDTLGDLTSSLNQALGELGHPPHPAARVRNFIGDGVETLIRKALPATAASPGTVQRLILDFRRVYQERWYETTKPYPGIPELLDQLTRAGLPLAILSNKPHAYTVQMVHKVLGSWTFAGIIGAGEAFPLKPDPAGALHLAESMGIAPDRCALVGDSEVDIATALATRGAEGAGMTPMAVTWGFRDESDLAAAGARLMIHKPAELTRILLD